MGDLDHNYYYSWRINWSLPAGETITGATLTFKNIWDWEYGEPDILYIHLLDNPPTLATTISSNLSRGYDNESGGDYWNGKGPLIGTWSDPKGVITEHIKFCICPSPCRSLTLYMPT